MITRSGIGTALACLIMLVSAAAIGTGTVLCNGTSRNRPANDLAMVAKPTPAPGPELLFSSDLRGDTHRQPAVIRTPVPVPTPVLIISQQILIRTRHQHQFALATNLANDIRNAGGHLVKFNYDFLNHDTSLTATVPSQYLDRIEPLLRKSGDHINPHYETWSTRAATPATGNPQRRRPAHQREF